MPKETVALTCPCCSRFIWPRAALALSTRPPRRGVFAVVVQGRKGGGWKVSGSVPMGQAPTMGVWFAVMKLRLAQAFSEWFNLGLITPHDMAMAGSWTTVERPPPTVTTEKYTWARRAISTKRDERAAVRSQVLKFDITKDWEARGPARALFEDTSARAIENLHGFEPGKDARVFARMNGDGEGEVHIVSADAEARAAIKAAIEARKVHVVEHEIAKPELGAAKRVQSAWSAGDMLPPRQREAPSRNARVLPARRDDEDAEE